MLHLLPYDCLTLGSLSRSRRRRARGHRHAYTWYNQAALVD